MEQPNWWLIPAVAIIPLIIGFIWYNPAVFGKAWMKAAEVDEERVRSINPVKTYGLTFLYSIFAAYLLAMFAVHQTSIFQLVFSDPSFSDESSDTYQMVSNFMAEFGGTHRSFGHGIIHGLELALLSGLVFVGVPAMFEARSFKYTMIHTGYWIVCFILMGGILCVYF